MITYSFTFYLSIYLKLANLFLGPQGDCGLYTDRLLRRQHLRADSISEDQAAGYEMENIWTRRHLKGLSRHPTELVNMSIHKEPYCQKYFSMILLDLNRVLLSTQCSRHLNTFNEILYREYQTKLCKGPAVAALYIPYDFTILHQNYYWLVCACVCVCVCVCVSETCEYDTRCKDTIYFVVPIG